MKPPMTQAIRHLKKHKIQFSPFLYEYQERGGTAASAAALNVDEHMVIKTIVLRDPADKLVLALMHGDCEVATKKLAGHLGVKNLSPCPPELAEKKTGYQFGGTSPFGLKTKIAVFAAQTIRDLDQIWINGGKRGFLVKVDPHEALPSVSTTYLDLQP